MPRLSQDVPPSARDRLGGPEVCHGCIRRIAAHGLETCSRSSKVIAPQHGRRSERMGKLKSGKTAPKSGNFLAWGKPKETSLIKFSSPGWHVAYWDNIDQAFCLSGATWAG